VGEQIDQNLGTYYLRQRYYDLETGRFTARDTYQGRQEHPESLHKYSYVKNNPTNLIDPSGLFFTGELIAADVIRNILAGMQVDTGQRLLGMVLGDEPTPEEFARDTLFALGLIAATPLIGVGIMYLRRSRAIGRIAERAIRSRGLNRIGSCDECAELLKTEFIRRNISGRHIRLETGARAGAAGRIGYEGIEEPISLYGFHEGVVVRVGEVDMVYDNINPRGVPYDEWMSNLYSAPGVQLKVIKDELFSP
jgi:RHS repeat-associated protein